MATPAASLGALPPTSSADPTPPATTRTQTTGTTGNTGQFQAALTAAGQSAQATQAVSGTDADTGIVDDTTDTTDTTDADAVANGLIGLVNQFTFLNPAVNAAVAQANGTAAPDTLPDLIVEANTSTDATRTRADELLLNNPNQAGQTPPATQQQPNAATLPATNAANTRTAVPVPELTVPTIPAVPAPAPDGAVELAVDAAGRTNIPPPAPVVANYVPPAPADLSTLEPVVNGTIETSPAAGLPATSAGDRPATAGEKFAAIASAGAQLAGTAPQPPASGVFENVLDAANALADSATNLPPSALTNDAVASITNLLDAQLSKAGPAGLASNADATAAVNAFATPATYNQPTSAPSPTSPSAPAPAASPMTESMAQAVVSHARVMERPGSVEFQMRLDPPELGRMQIRLVTHGDEIHGQVLVAHDAVRQLIESQLPELRQRLEAAGVNVQQFNVATDANTGGGRNPYREAAEFAPPVARPEATPAPRARIGRAAAGSLDVTV
jgi:hypothetical protein